MGANDKLTRVKLATVGVSLEPVKNLNIRITGSYRSLSSATDTFSIDYLKEDGTIGNDCATARDSATRLFSLQSGKFPDMVWRELL